MSSPTGGSAPAATDAPAASAPRLVRAAPRLARPVRLDESQRRVVEHRDGPLVVLAGPGTGKTATLVEAVAARVELDGLSPEHVLVLTFSRRAADELRTRLSARLRRTVRGRLAWTFHSWCYALVRAFSPEFAGGAPRLLSGPEQDVVVRELLQGHAEGRAASAWPEELRPLLRSRGFAGEVRDLMARCQERGLEPEDLDRLGEMSGRPAWRAVAAFAQEYQQVLGLQGALDYAGLVRRASGLLAVPEILADVLRNVRLVVVDEYQDTDPSQEQVLAQLASGGADVLVVGDPDQSIYAFRGADVTNILEFPRRFRRLDGRPARRLTLGTCRRSGPVLVAASRSAASRIPLPGLSTKDAEAHRRLKSAPGSADDGAVSVRLFGSPAHEATAVADLLRRAHLVEGIDWGSMAVLVRSTRSAGPLVRALADAGVPTETPSDEVPLARESTLAPLLTLLRLVVDPSRWEEECTVALLTSPLGGADALQVRRLRHALLTEERAAGGTRRSGELLAALVQDPARVAAMPERLRVAPTRISQMYEAARVATVAGRPAEDVLWAVWADSDWRRELEAASAAGSGLGVRDAAATGSGVRAAARHADRQLDAMVALFEAAARFGDRLPGARLPVFLDELSEQEIPADPLSQGEAPAAAVQVLTAHRSKGLEWDLVVVAGVQEGGWPDLRRRQSLLETAALPAVLSASQAAGSWAASPTGDLPLPLPPPMPPAGELAAAERAAALADERRLFYVAVTRARRRVVCTAVTGGDELELRPSRLLGDLGVPVPAEPEPAPRVLALPALVAELRRVASDPQESDALRAAAVDELARLADTVRAADPDSWWGLLPWSERAEPLVPADGPVRLSPSQVEAIARCPLQWFLRRRAGVESGASTSQGFGVLMHALAELVVRSGSLDLDDLQAKADEVWSDLDWEAPWYAERERAAAREVLRRFGEWHQGRSTTVVGAEVGFEVQVGRAVVAGQIDRLERDDQGRGYVVDLKTGKNAVVAADLEQHPQLGLYQLAVAQGGIEGQDFSGAGGGMLLQLRAATSKGPKEQTQPALEPEADGRTWVHDMLDALVEQVVSEQFPARRNSGCERCEVRRACPAQPEGAQVVG